MTQPSSVFVARVLMPATSEPAFWRLDLPREVYPQVERSRTPPEGTLAVTERSVVFLPLPGATSVRIPYELVEDGLISPDNFRDFTFANAVHLWGTQNPRFFEGTAVARAAAEELAREPVRTAAT